jgi:hypothetical protein
MDGEALRWTPERVVVIAALAFGHRRGDLRHRQRGERLGLEQLVGAVGA